MSKGQRYDMLQRVDRLVENMKEGLGDAPIAFLDSSSIIDFENEMKNARLIDQQANIIDFYRLLQNKLNFPIYVSNHIHDELKPHRRVKIGRLQELSLNTFEIVERMNRSYCDFIKNVRDSSFDIDQIRHDVYWASLFAFEKNHKKYGRDPISKVDKELLTAALWARYTINPNGDYFEDKHVTGAVIISSDCHISETAKILTNGMFNYKSLRVISSR